MAQVDSKTKGPQTDLLIKSIGVCVAQTTDKKKKPCVVVAYDVAGKISFFFMPMPTKGLYGYADFTKAIALVEEVKNATYVGYDGAAKAIYCCRAEKGKVTDVVPRDYEHNHYLDGFSEIVSSNLPFSIVKEEYAKKFLTKFEVEFTIQKESDYVEDSYEYAVNNAYNACLLGRIFEHEELQVETKSKQRVKIEVKNATSKFMELETLYIYPRFNASTTSIECYETEEFTFIDGGNVSKIAYKIVYNRRLNDYIIMRK